MRPSQMFKIKNLQEAYPSMNMYSSQILMSRTGFTGALLKTNIKWIYLKSHPISTKPPVPKKHPLQLIFPNHVLTVRKECST